MSIKERIKGLEKSFNNETYKKKTLEEDKASLESKIKRLEEEEEELLLKRELLNDASEKAREDGMRVLADTATNAVQAILGEDVFVEITSKDKGGSAYVDVKVKRTVDGMEVVTDPTNGEGGGVADIVSLAMFFSLGLLVGSDNEAPLFLDEPTKFLSKGYSEEAAEFIREMVDYTGKQTFLVTHDSRIKEEGDKTYKVTLDEDFISVVEEI